MGSLERTHRDIKSGLRASLQHMGDQHGENWLSALPWVLLGRRTAFQPDLGTCSAELVLGDTPTIPGDLAGSNLQVDANIPALLERLRAKADIEDIACLSHEEREHLIHMIQQHQRPDLLEPADLPRDARDHGCRGGFCALLR